MFMHIIASAGISRNESIGYASPYQFVPVPKTQRLHIDALLISIDRVGPGEAVIAQRPWANLFNLRY